MCSGGDGLPSKETVDDEEVKYYEGDETRITRSFSEEVSEEFQKKFHKNFTRISEEVYLVVRIACYRSTCTVWPHQE